LFASLQQELDAQQAEREAKERQKKAHGDAKFRARIARKNLRAVKKKLCMYMLYISMCTFEIHVPMRVFPARICAG